MGYNFHCMDDTAQISSAQKPETSSPTPITREKQWWRRLAPLGESLTIGTLIGGILAGIILWFPYNRVVVFDQPMSQSIRISSLRITHGGFVAVYVKYQGGWTLTGESYYLPAGYYRDVVVTVNPVPLIDQFPTEYVVRLYRDTGNSLFDPLTDIPVNDVFGRLYSKRFFLYFDKARKYFIRNMIANNPVQFIIDTLFP